MILRLLALGLLAGFIKALPQQQPNLDDLIKEVFGNDPANNPTPPNNQGQIPPIDQADPTNSNGQKNVVRDTPDTNEDCTCVPYYLCPNGTVLTDGTGLLDIRAKAGACDEYMDVCCNSPIDNPIKPPPLKRRGCGQRHQDGVGFRITGDKDNEAQFGEFPWMVALLKKTTLENEKDLMVYQCGGALIHERLVLTAAHCVIPNSDTAELVARVGEWDTQRVTEIFPHQNIKVSKVIIHPDFKRGNLHNDFAILLLEKPVTFAENVDTVCLPTAGVVPLSRECFATGWGKDKFEEEPKGLIGTLTQLVRRRPKHIRIPIVSGVLDGLRTVIQDLGLTRGLAGSFWPGERTSKGDRGSYQVILKKVDLPIVPKDYCINLLRKTRLGPFFKLHDSFVCAGGVPGKDTCKGDGGSPMVCPIEGKPGTYEVTGLVAWGIGCGGETPGVYAGVAYARPWIDHEVAQLGLQIE